MPHYEENCLWVLYKVLLSLSAPTGWRKGVSGPKSSLWLISSGPSRLLPVSSIFLSHMHQSGLRQGQREPDVVTHTCQIKLRQEDDEFEAILHYIEKHHHLHPLPPPNPNKQADKQTEWLLRVSVKFSGQLFLLCLLAAWSFRKPCSSQL